MATLRKLLVVCFGLIFASCFTFFFTSCAVKKGGENGEDELSRWMKSFGQVKVCATTPLIADTVRQIGGDHISVISLMGPDIDPHSYEIVKGDHDKISHADLVFANGLSLEHSRSMQRVLGEHKNVVFVSERIPNNEIIIVDGSPDPHIWMDVELWSLTTFPIQAALSKIDPKNAELYRERAEAVRVKYKLINEEIKARMQSIPAARRRLVTSHDAFNYFAKQYLAKEGEWKSRVIAIQGLAPEEQISSSEIKRVVDYVINYNVKVIFAEKNLSRDSLLKVVDACRRSGQYVALAKEELFGDTMGKGSYIEMMEHNAKVIELNLKYEDDPKARPQIYS